MPKEYILTHVNIMMRGPDERIHLAHGTEQELVEVVRNDIRQRLARVITALDAPDIVREKAEIKLIYVDGLHISRTDAGLVIVGDTHSDMDYYEMIEK